MESIDNYSLLKVLGKGSFATVHLAKVKQTGQEVALKQVVFKEARQKEKQCALNQARLLASISHPNIINFKTAFFDNQNERLYISMEYASKGDLSNRIQYLKQKKRYLNQDQIWKFIRQTASALDVLHENNIIHRDLKSANIFMTQKGDYKIADFNVAKLVKSYDGLAETQTGTPLYACPEIWSSNGYDSKSDIWSLGVITYELTSLQLPFPASTFPELLKKITKGQFKRIPSPFSDDLQRVIANMMHKNPNKRPTAKQLIQYSMFEQVQIPQDIMIKKKYSMIETIQDPMQLSKISKRLNTFESSDEKQKNQIFPSFSMLEKNNQNLEHPVVTIKDRVKSFHRGRAITANQRVVPNKGVEPLEKQKVGLKPMVLNINIPFKHNIPVPLTERDENTKYPRKYVKLPSLSSQRNSKII